MPSIDLILESYKLYISSELVAEIEMFVAAIDLFLSSQIREGVWNSFCIGSIYNRIRMIEEEGSLPGEEFIPESRRNFITSVDADCGSCNGGPLRIIIRDYIFNY